MSWTRREFLSTGSIVVGGLIADPSFVPGLRLAARDYRPYRPLINDPDIRQVAGAALEAARVAGARYADVRIASGNVRTTIMFDRRVTTQQTQGQLNFGIRVIVGGAWGFASSTIVTEAEATRVAQLAVRQASQNPWGSQRNLELAPAPVVPDGRWETPIDLDPWDHTIQEQLALQLEANEAIMKAGEASGQ